MASISRESNGRRTIQFVGVDGKRRSIRLGKVSQRAAEAVKVRVEHLANAAESGGPLDPETARWVAEIGDDLADKLARVGLIPERQTANLGDFLEGYIQGRVDMKPLSITMMRQAQGDLVTFFGADRAMQTISQGDADRWRLWLVSRGLADNTIRRRCGRAKQFFRAAMRHKLVATNAFADLKSTVQPNHKRFHYVTREDAAKVLDACPDAQWRLLFALARYGGVRIPSEVMGMVWGDVDWERGRLTIRSPKTEHHPGRDCRVIPLFPELRPHLEAVWELADEGTEHVITRYRDSNANLRTQLGRIIRRAGLEPWPKLFVNLRSTRETELAGQFPMHVVCKWIGNTEPVAARHYLQVTDEHYAEAVQKAVQQLHAGTRTDSQDGSEDSTKPRKCRGLRDSATVGEVLQLGGLAEAGFEPARAYRPTGF